MRQLMLQHITAKTDLFKPAVQSHSDLWAQVRWRLQSTCLIQNRIWADTDLLCGLILLCMPTNLFQNVTLYKYCMDEINDVIHYTTRTLSAHLINSPGSINYTTIQHLVYPLIINFEFSPTPCHFITEENNEAKVRQHCIELVQFANWKALLSGS